MKAQLLNFIAMAFALLAAASSVQSIEDTALVRKSLRGFADSASASNVATKEYGEVVFAEGAAELENSCNRHCTEDSDCQTGGFVTCYKCGQYEGARYYHMCYDPSTPSPTPPPNQVGQCGRHCHNDHNCQHGGFNPCGVCNKVHGTFGYNTCIEPDEDSATVSNIDSEKYPEVFAEGAAELENSCNRHCTEDSDCQTGGFVTCSKCGQYEGARYYHTCYDPSTDAPTYSPTPPPNQEGMCGLSCHHDHDCQHGGFNPCGVCNKIHGTFGYNTCIEPDEVEDEE